MCLRKYQFSKKLKLSRPEHFRLVFSSGKRLFGHFFVLVYRPNSLGYPRLGVVLRKSVFRTSVKRNLVRRVVQELFRLRREELLSYDVIFVSQAAAQKASRQEWQQCIENLWTQLVSASAGFVSV